MPAENPFLLLEQADWKAIATFVGIAIGTAAAIFLQYRRSHKAAETGPTKDVVLPSTAIADMRWGPELLIEVRAMNGRIGEIHACMTDWRQEYDIDRAYEKGRRDRDRGGRRQAD